MCRSGDTDHMPVGTTWGILPPSGMNSSILFPQFLINMSLIDFFYSSRPSSSFSRGMEFPGKNLQQNKIRGEDVGELGHT